MNLFSQRKGLTKISSLIQKDSADERLRNALWNGLTIYYFERFEKERKKCDTSIRYLISRIWTEYYGRRIDEIFNYTESILDLIKKDFIFSDWHKMYDILEFIPNNYYEDDDYQNFENELNLEFIINTNEILAKHLSAYRFVNNQLCEINSELEIQSIENALKVTSKYESVQVHLIRALELYSDRDNPDYRNSIKESISSIEALSCIITQNPKSTLGQALNEIEKQHNLHKALKNSFSSLYGYTSDNNGIRHALLDESKLSAEDALFMLVTCSAFINYLLVKTELNNLI